MTTSGQAAVSPFDVFLAAWLPRRPSAPGFPVIRARWTRIGPPEAPKWSNLHEWSREGASPPASTSQSSAIHDLPSSSRLLHSVVGGFSHTWATRWASHRAPPRRTSAASTTRWTSTPSKPSHQDPRRVHPWPLCPNSCTYAAPQAHAPIKSHRIRKARPSTLIHHFPRRDQAEPVCCGLPTCHKYVAHGSLPYFQR